jgi:uncharacterized membrane protein YbhN (UPF0104 family)
MPDHTNRDRLPGPQLFASAPDEARARRPTDVLLAVISAVALVLTAVASHVGEDLDAGLSAALQEFPPFLDPLWLGLAWSALVWAVVLIGAALVRHRRPLARDILAGVVVATIVGALVSELIAGDFAEVLTRLGDVDGPPTYPPGAIALASAALAVASPHLTRPFRHLGRWLVGGQVVGLTMLGGATLGGTTAAVWVGLLAGAAVHLLVGSPGGRPTSSRIDLALRELGVEPLELRPAAMQSGGVVRFQGRDREGPLDVRVYGRDAWDAQLMATLWRLALYRGAQRTPRLSRVQLVEHEGFVTLLAERAGVDVAHVVTAGSAGQGDALMVQRPAGPTLAEQPPPPLGPEAVDALWRDLRRLHGTGIVHRGIDLDAVVVRDDHHLGFGSLRSATVAPTVDERRSDEAQALVLTVLVAGEDLAVARARAALGDERLLDVLPYVQAAALPPGVRSALDEAAIELDDLRNRIRVTLGADEQQLIRLRRVTAGSLLNLLLLAVAAYALISAFGGMDLETLVDALADASWWWLAFALLLGQLPRIPSAVSTTGALEAPVPLGPLVALQFAICFVNLAVPSTAARVAINVRFFQRFGVPPATAMTAGVIDSVSGFIVQIVLFLTIFFASDLDLGFSADPSSTEGLGTIVLIALGLLVAAVVVVAIVPSLRAWILGVLRQAAAGLEVLRVPSKLVRLFGGNLVSQILFAVAFATCAQAFGVQLPLSQFILINTVVSLFAGLLPVPGGIGVSEAGLTLGLTTAGVQSEVAFAIALTFRFVTFYLPPIWGWLCYRWLLRRQFL